MSRKQDAAALAQINEGALSHPAIQFKPGGIVVTAGGTEGGGPTVVKVGPRAHSGGLMLIVGGGHAGGWNQDGSPYGEACITMTGRILRLATPEEAESGRVMTGKEFFAQAFKHTRSPNMARLAFESMAEPAAPPTKRRKGWAGNTLWKGRKLKTYAPQQLMGIAARHMEAVDSMDARLVSVGHEMATLRDDRDHHKGQAEFLAKEVERVRSQLDLVEGAARHLLRARRFWMILAAVAVLGAGTIAIIYLPAPSWVPGWMLK